MSLLNVRRVESPNNELIKQLVRLLDSPIRLRAQGVAVAEGLHLFQSLLKYHQDYPVDCVVLPEALLSNTEWQSLEALWLQCLKNHASHIQPSKIIVPTSVYKKLSRLNTPTGPLVFFGINTKQQPLDLRKDMALLDGVQDPSNVGALLRNCAAAGIAQVVFSPSCAWGWGDKALRAGMGAQFALHFFTEQVLLEAMAVASKPAFAIRVTNLSEQSENLFDADLTAPGLWVFGNEGQGVRSEWLVRSNQHIRIDQTDWVESLNVASSSAICFFEQQRQRAKLKQETRVAG